MKSNVRSKPTTPYLPLALPPTGTKCHNCTIMPHQCFAPPTSRVSELLKISQSKEAVFLLLVLIYAVCSILDAINLKQSTEELLEL